MTPPRRRTASTPTGSRRGRRPAGTDARGDIVEAARVEFAERGYDAASLRNIARRAGVDPALVHHYFEGKPALFAQVLTVPVNPGERVAMILAVPREQVGEAVVRSFLFIWDAPGGRERFQALARSALGNAAVARQIREFLIAEIFVRVSRHHASAGESDEDLELRASLAAGQMIGFGLMRYVLEFPAAKKVSAERAVAELGPTLQRYLAP